MHYDLRKSRNYKGFGVTPVGIKNSLRYKTLPKAFQHLLSLPLYMYEVPSVITALWTCLITDIIIILVNNAVFFIISRNGSIRYYAGT